MDFFVKPSSGAKTATPSRIFTIRHSRSTTFECMFRRVVRSRRLGKIRFKPSTSA